MPNALSLTDGTTTISLSSSGCLLTHYVPDGPEMQANGEYKPITETVEFTIVETTTALVRTKLNLIERLLAGVNNRLMNRTGPRVYLAFQATGDAAASRSELTNYRLFLEPDAAVAFAQGILGVRLIVTRVPFWEGARTAIPLTNGNGTNVTSGLTIKAHDDATVGDDNWCNIAGSTIAGSLPSPLEIRMVNNSGAGREYHNFFVANNTVGQALAHIIEGESMVSGYGTAYADAACSNGNYTRRTGAGWLTFRWVIPTASLALFRGRYVRILARFRTLNSADRDIRLTLHDNDGLTILARSPQTVAKNGAADIQDCGALALPSAGYATNWATVVLEVAVFTPASETVEIDFIQLTPAEPMQYRRITQVAGYLHPVDDAVVDDGIEGLVYFETTATGLRELDYIARNEPVCVWPGVDQRLLILHDGAASLPAWSLSVQAWYRPRRTLF